jgi:two-component system, sensor histidine kinase PdtaS
MQDENMTCTSVDGANTADNPAKAWGGNSQREILDLRLEAMELRRRLALAQEVASRHAIMLREGDHRIKNSLQLVSSLMRVQARREASVPARDALQSAAARVTSIASIHDALQVTGGLDLVDIGSVLRTMCTSLQDMAGDHGHIEIRVDVEALQIPVQLAQSIALAVNELVVNALRHAFPGRVTGAVRITMTRADDTLTICVADDGVGLPAGHANGTGYGMKLVKMMIDKIGGDILTETKDGTCFTIRAPLNRNASARV